MATHGFVRPSSSMFISTARPSFAFTRYSKLTPNAHGSMSNQSLIMRTLVIYPYNFSLTNTQKSRITTRRISASAQPVAEKLVQPQAKDNPTSGNSIRRKFIDFYASHGHKVLPSASLVPDDPTVLLTIAGMLQFKPIFLGKVPRQVPRATSAQRCIRTNDIENVGRTTRHHTFFEMLGNFSFGDYFKKEAIKWAWELSTVEYGLSADKLWISVYKDDNEAFAIWRDELGVPVERIKRMGEEDNFWSSGATGPCGPCSEIYYDFHPERGYSDVVCVYKYMSRIWGMIPGL